MGVSGVVNCLPFVSFKVLEFNAQRIVLIVCQHVNVLVAQPELLSWVSETVLVVGPVSVKVLARLPEIVTSLNHRPATVSDLLLAEDLQEPVSGAANLQVVDARLLHARIEQIHARVALEKKHMESIESSDRLERGSRQVGKEITRNLASSTGEQIGGFWCVVILHYG